MAEKQNWLVKYYEKHAWSAMARWPEWKLKAMNLDHIIAERIPNVCPTCGHTHYVRKEPFNEKAKEK